MGREACVMACSPVSIMITGVHIVFHSSMELKEKGVEFVDEVEDQG